MLETLRIQNYALIDDLEIDFGGAFNALTGETGAGKSIIVGALNLALGERASGEVLRDDQRSAKIDAVFRLKKPSLRLDRLLNQHDILCKDGELILENHHAGRTKSRLRLRRPCSHLVVGRDRR